MEPSSEKFEFTVDLGEEKIRVSVYAPVNTGEKIGYTDKEAKNKPKLADAIYGVNKLQPTDITYRPNPTVTLVDLSKEKKDFRIDSQPAGNCWRNFHIQSGKHTFAVCKVEHGGQLCFPAGYGERLLRYVKRGLYESLEKGTKCNIPVRLARKKKGAKDWSPLKVKDGKELEQIVKFLSQRKQNREKANEKKQQLARNLYKITKKTAMIDHIIAAIEKNIVKATEKEGAEMVAMKIPLISTFLGIYLGACRAKSGDFTGAFLEVASGVLADVPGPGTGASLAIDLTLLAKDIAEVVQDEKKHKQLLEKDIEALKKENKKIQKDVNDLLPESPIYGEEGAYAKSFNEANLGNVCDIAKIHIKSSEFIDAIQVEYRNKERGAVHGGKGGTLKTLALAPHERITAVSVSTNQGAVCGLAFSTDAGRHESFGTIRSSAKDFEMTNGMYLAAFKGYDMFKDGDKVTKSLPSIGGNREVLPAIGFVAK